MDKFMLLLDWDEAGGGFIPRQGVKITPVTKWIQLHHQKYRVGDDIIVPAFRLCIAQKGEDICAVIEEKFWYGGPHSGGPVRRFVNAECLGRFFLGIPG